MNTLRTISNGECIQVDTSFQTGPLSLSIAETKTGYTLYKSTICPDVLTGRRQWAELSAEQDCPAGWKACSDAIPADTQHDVFDITRGTLFFLKGCNDEIVYFRY